MSIDKLNNKGFHLEHIIPLEGATSKENVTTREDQEIRVKGQFLKREITFWATRESNAIIEGYACA